MAEMPLRIFVQLPLPMAPVGVSDLRTGGYHTNMPASGRLFRGATARHGLRCSDPDLKKSAVNLSREGPLRSRRCCSIGCALVVARAASPCWDT